MFMSAKMRFVQEPVEVEARFEAGGRVTPLHITRGARRVPVIDVGRQWDAGGGRYVLVTTPDGSSYELRLDKESMSWQITRTWEASSTA